jgi:hypothetical protein
MLFADGPAEPVVKALRGYRKPDGGFGRCGRANPLQSAPKNCFSKPT